MAINTKRWDKLEFQILMALNGGYHKIKLEFVNILEFPKRIQVKFGRLRLSELFVSTQTMCTLCCNLFSRMLFLGKESLETKNFQKEIQVFPVCQSIWLSSLSVHALEPSPTILSNNFLIKEAALVA